MPFCATARACSAAISPARAPPPRAHLVARARTRRFERVFSVAHRRPHRAVHASRAPRVGGSSRIARGARDTCRTRGTAARSIGSGRWRPRRRASRLPRRRRRRGAAFRSAPVTSAVRAGARAATRPLARRRRPGASRAAPARTARGARRGSRSWRPSSRAPAWRARRAWYVDHDDTHAGSSAPRLPGARARTARPRSARPRPNSTSASPPTLRRRLASTTPSTAGA